MRSVSMPTVFRAARVLRAMAAAAVSCLAGACAVVTSETLEDLAVSGEEPNGIYYALPMGLVDVTLVVNHTTGDFRVLLDEPNYIADPQQRYLMRYQPLPNYSDDVTIELNGRSLISRVHANTEDETDQIIVELAKLFRAAGGFQAGTEPAGFSHLASITIDPSEPQSVAKAERFLNAKARAYVEEALAVVCGKGKSDSQVCDTFEGYEQKGYRVVELNVVPPQGIGPHIPADCSRGLCYRVKEPYVFEKNVGGYRSAEIVFLPNKAPLVELDIKRGFLINKIQTIDFDNNGFLKSAYVKKDSELLALSNIPLNVITAITSTVPFRLTVEQKQLDLAKARAAEYEARKELADLQANQNAPQKGSEPQ